MFKKWVNTKNLNRYKKITKKINKLAQEYENKINPQQIPAELINVKNSSKISMHEKTLRAMALTKNAAKHVLGMTYYDVQIMGALALTDGNIAEMKTGEGKTLTCSAAVASNFVQGFKTHVVTANEYLAVRDLETLRPLYEFLGLSCGYNISTMNKAEKRVAYSNEVLYSVATELGFDYLRDNLLFKYEDKVQVMSFEGTKALIDEADFILIDEARTPLIISSPTSDISPEKYHTMIKIVDSLDKMSKEPSINSLWEEKIDGDFWLDEKIKRSYFSEDGYTKIEKLVVENQLVNKAEELYNPENAWIIREIHNAINAKYLYLKDKDYIVRYGEVVIIDPNTGRLSEGRSWSNGLNQAIEAKENITIKPENSSAGSISVQNYFRLYSQISGMSGTIMTSSEEFEFIYNTSTIAIPKNKPEKRINHPDRLFASTPDKYSSIMKEIKKRTSKGQPILLGTVSVQESEIISNFLNKAKIPHNVLNAKNHHYEAHIIAQAGKPGAVTVATSMAGRGTDIILGGNYDAFKGIIQGQIDSLEERRRFFSASHGAVVEAIKQQNPDLQIESTPIAKNEKKIHTLTSSLIEQEAVSEDVVQDLHENEEEEDILALINKCSSLENKEEENKNVKEIVEQLKKEIEGISEDSDTHIPAVEKKQIQLNTNKVNNKAEELSIDVFPESMFEAQKPEILLGAHLSQLEFPQSMLDEASEIKKMLEDAKENHQQELHININEFVMGGYNEDTSTSEVVDYHLVTSQLLLLYHPAYYTPIIHAGPAYFNRLLNVLENTILHERDLMDNGIEQWRKTVLEAGGLCVIGCSRNESRRIDNQLIGRSGRQGDPGESIFFLSLEDEWIRVFCEGKLFNMLKQMIETSQQKYIEGNLMSSQFVKIQGKCEEQSYAGRKNTFQYDVAVDDARKGFLNLRNIILENPLSIKSILHEALMKDLKPITHVGFFDHLSENISMDSSIKEVKKAIFNMPVDAIKNYANLYLKDQENAYIPELLMKDREINEQIKDELSTNIKTRIELLNANDINDLSVLCLQSLDKLWMALLNSLEEMQQNVALRQVAQKNPLYEFKILCFESFSDLLDNFNIEVIENYKNILQKDAIMEIEDDFSGVFFDDNIVLEKNE